MLYEKNDFNKAHTHECISSVVDALISVNLTPVSGHRDKDRDHEWRE